MTVALFEIAMTGFAFAAGFIGALIGLGAPLRLTGFLGRSNRIRCTSRPA
jgi:hypothetical protein